MSGHRRAAFDRELLPLLDEAFDFARHLTHDVDAAEELTQAAFARAFETFHQFREGTSARAWLFTIMRNRHLNEARSVHRHAAVPLELVGEASGALGEALTAPPESPADATPALDEAIARLPVNLREVVVLDLQGMTCREIGAVVGCPAGTVMSRLYRARQLLRSLLEERGVSQGGRR
jgi:RNA polymerase sigma-70 factor, ECF subfamily